MTVKRDFLQLSIEDAPPSPPPSGFVRLYAGGDGTIKSLDSTGGEAQITNVPTGLNELSDFSVSSPTEGQTLRYDGSNWVNNIPITVPSELGDLGDINDAPSSLQNRTLTYRKDLTGWVEGISHPTILYQGSKSVIPATSSSFARDKSIRFDLANDGTNIAGDITEFSPDRTSGGVLIEALGDNTLFPEISNYVLSGWIRLKNGVNIGNVFVTPAEWLGYDANDDHTALDPYFFINGPSPSYASVIGNIEDVLQSVFFGAAQQTYYLYPFWVMQPSAASSDNGLTLGIYNDTDGNIDVTYSLTWRRFSNKMLE